MRRVIDKIAQERIRILRADPEFVKLKKLVPTQLRKKELGKDIHGITTDSEYVEKRGDDEVILLSKRDWDRYEEFERLCQKLAQIYRLHWATVEDLGLGVKQPTVSPRPSQIIDAYLDPVVFVPKDFDSNLKYVAHSTTASPLAVMEIMRRVEGLDEKTKEEIKAYLSSLFKHIPGCQIVELSEAADALKEQDEKVEFDVCLRVPLGYTAREVAEVYRKVDNKRRGISASLGMSVHKRRRQSRILMNAKSLRLCERGVSIYDIIDDKYPDADSSQEQSRRRAIINQRLKGQRLLKNHLM